MDGTELLIQMNALGTECKIVWALRVYSNHRLRVTPLQLCIINSADQRTTKRWGTKQGQEEAADHFKVNLSLYLITVHPPPPY